MSRNKREGQYAGRWKEPFTGIRRKHHRIFHHKVKANFPSVGQKLLLEIF